MSTELAIAAASLVAQSKALAQQELAFYASSKKKKESILEPAIQRLRPRNAFEALSDK